jgi:hypothetical protein
VQRYLKTRNRSYQFENVFLKFAETVAKSSDQDEMQPLFAELHGQLKVLEQDPFEKSAFEYFDFPAWAEAKASGKLFSEIVKDKAGLTEELG